MATLPLLLAISVAATPPASKPQGVSTGDLPFAIQLYRELSSQAGNLFLSPASIRIALAMTMAGARERTASEMEKTLLLPSNDTTHADFQKLLKRWNDLGRLKKGSSAGDPELDKYRQEEAKRVQLIVRIVNALWGQTGYAFQPAFLALTKERYGAQLQSLDFKANPEAARATINKAISDQTEKKIPELLAAGQIQKDARLVLTNAVYFKATWATTFEPEATRKEAFQTGPKTTTKVPMMHQLDHFAIADIPGGQMLELPYASQDWALDVVLPRKVDGLKQMEDAFAKGALPDWIARLRGHRVDVALPRFKVGASFALADVLQKLGMKDAFKYPGADFSGIDGTHELYVGNVVHQAVIDVNEVGTEAAAATAVIMAEGTSAQTEPPVVFRADHPFLFFIRDTKSGAILFLGRLVEPG